MAKKPTVSGLKKKCWSLFSEVVRRTHADFEGFASCVTCGRRYEWKKLHAGHLVSGRGNSILFDERGVYPQCYGCNIGKSGAVLEYVDFIETLHGKRAGKKLIKELRQKAKQTKTFTIGELEELRNELETKIQKLDQM